jgi:hypothetical protein
MGFKIRVKAFYSFCFYNPDRVGKVIPLLSCFMKTLSGLKTEAIFNSLES